MIGNPLGLGQNQFNSVIQGPTSEPYPSNFNLGCWNYSNSSWDKSDTNSQSNWSSIDPTYPQFEFNGNHEDTQPTLEETFEAFMQLSKRMLSDSV